MLAVLIAKQHLLCGQHCILDGGRLEFNAHWNSLLTCSVETSSPPTETGMSAPTSAFVSSGVAITASSLRQAWLFLLNKNNNNNKNKNRKAPFGAAQVQEHCSQLELADSDRQQLMSFISNRYKKRPK